MTCTTCTEARPAPEHFRLFAEGCIYCAARRIQYIQRRLSLSTDVKRNRCRTALEQAMALGLPEQEIRSMAKLAEWQIKPAQQAESSTAPRKRGR